MIKKTLFFSIIQKNYVPLRSNLNVEPFKVRKGQPNEYKVSIHPHRVLVAATDGWLRRVMIIYQTLIIILFLTTQTSWSVHNLYSLWTLNRKN